LLLSGNLHQAITQPDAPHDLWPRRGVANSQANARPALGGFLPRPSSNFVSPKAAKNASFGEEVIQ